MPPGIMIPSMNSTNTNMMMSGPEPKNHFSKVQRPLRYQGFRNNYNLQDSNARNRNDNVNNNRKYQFHSYERTQQSYTNITPPQSPPLSSRRLQPSFTIDFDKADIKKREPASSNESKEELNKRLPWYSEANACVEFLISFLKQFNKNVKPLSIQKMKNSMMETLNKRYEGHWYLNNPIRGSGYRSLSFSSDQVDPILEDAVSIAGGKPDYLKKHVKHEFTVWVDPGTVCWRSGKSMVIKNIYSTSSPGTSPTLNSDATAFCPTGSPPQSPIMSSNSPRVQMNSPNTIRRRLAKPIAIVDPSYNLP